MIAIATEIGILALFLACVVLAGYIIFFPLVRTIVGGVQIFRAYALRRDMEADLERAIGTNNDRRRMTR